MNDKKKKVVLFSQKEVIRLFIMRRRFTNGAILNFYSGFIFCVGQNVCLCGSRNALNPENSLNCQPKPYFLRREDLEEGLFLHMLTTLNSIF